MAEYILKQAGLDALQAEGITRNMRAYKMLQALKVSDVEPVRHGRWVKSDKYKGFLCCSACSDCYVLPGWLNNDKWSFCPHCGAKMDG